MEGQRKLHNEKLYNVDSLPDIIKMIKSRRKEAAWKTEPNMGWWCEIDLEETGRRVLIGFIGLKIGTTVISYEHGDGNFLSSL